MLKENNRKEFCNGVIRMTNVVKTESLFKQLKNHFKKSYDFKHETLKTLDRDFHILYISTIVKINIIDDSIVRPLKDANNLCKNTKIDTFSLIESIIPLNQYRKGSDFKKCIECLLDGDCILLPSNSNTFFSYPVINDEYRSISEPKTEPVLRGPREGFVECLHRNIPLIRKRLRSKHLMFEEFLIGNETKTKVVISYLGNKASESTVNEFRTRLLSIDTDAILESSYIEEWIQDKTLTPFPQLINSERPDAVVGKLLEGSVAILIDGTPMALVGPITFFQLFQSPEDYYQRADIATLLRWLRMFSFMISVFVPALYICVISFNPELLPTSLLIKIAAQREQVPFPAFIEATIMFVTFEILREAGLRMPSNVGQTISIVGALVLGQAAVEAGLITAAMVIVVSITAIANFISPVYSFGIAQRIIQFIFMLLSSVLGLFGLINGVYFLLFHLVTLRSFGVQYFTPLAPLKLMLWNDTVIRVPHFLMKKKMKSKYRRS